MRVKAKKVKDGYLIPNIPELGNLEEVEVEINIIRIQEEKQPSDEYIAKHWKELIMTDVDSSDFYKSPEYYIERAEDYIERKGK